MLGSDRHELFGGGESFGSIGLVERSFLVEGMSCGACVAHVERALRGVSGVSMVSVSLEKGRAEVRYDPAATDFVALRQAVGAVGYELRDGGTSERNASSIVPVFAFSPKVIAWPTVIGLVAAALLASLYVIIVGITQDFGHAVELVTGDWYFVTPIAIGFGVQVGLFVYMRKVLKLRNGARSATALTGAGTGTSTVSMIACCAHHLADVLPVLGLSGAAVFLSDNRGPFMALGIATNLVGIAVMVRMIRGIGGQGDQTQ